ncbi:MAG: AcrB/AcrD/AcrF family protein [Woeseiaceae bacterium]|nr:AcrB/AcrD/AcrF family protein [Woeseiaceae bacterium]NIP20154.1 AcrB/AcrD/AcrF family protein [Woeseiaceae bacterium]NIS88950.1 AcrB/AcrD/AcrF family protein [Woeseiaceae bacterium]
MKITEFCLENRTTTLVLTVVMIFAGLAAYESMGRLEDPEFTIKDALVITQYPGASAEEVEEEVTDEIEIAIQQLGQLDEITSVSYRGLSIVTASMKERFDKNSLPQVWDELRRKVGDAQVRLPPGAGPSIVNDDFGDVYGIFFAIHGEEYSYNELWDVAKLLRRELLLVQDVAKVDIFGNQPEVIFVELDRDRLAQLGIPAAAIAQELQRQNLVTNSGGVNVGPEFIAVEPSHLVETEEDLGSIMISGSSTSAQIYLRDIATIERGYREPASSYLRFDGEPAIGIGISTVSGGNVVVMGEKLKARMIELASDIPLGMEFGVIALQSDAVQTAISSFVVSLLQAVAIVIVVLLFFMGLRSGLLIGFILFLTICGSFVFMKMAGVMLERISLGALIIALGMLVDNAIVVVDGMLVRFQQGMERRKAALEVVRQTAIPLLGATVIAVLAFAAIGTSQDNTGEYTRSLFTVIMISLLLSWLTAITVTPLLGVMFLETPKSEGGTSPYDSGFYRMFDGFLRGCIKARWLTITVVIAVFGSSVYGFGYVAQSFFPNSTRPQIMVDYWLPQGSSIETSNRHAAQVEDYLLELEGVKHVGTIVGQGAPRFLLTYTPEKANSAYTQFLVELDDATYIDKLYDEIQDHLDENFEEAQGQVRKFILGPGEPGKIQAKFFGPDPDVLRNLSAKAEAILASHYDAYGVRNDWRGRVKVLRPIIDKQQASQFNISRQEISALLMQAFEGLTVGVFREGDELLPIILRAPAGQRDEVASIRDLQIFSSAANATIPLRQVVIGFETVFEDEIIQRINRERVITALADPRHGEAPPMLNDVRATVEAIPLPEGYRLEWWGEYRNSGKAQAALASSIPVFLGMMVLITIALFNSLRQTAVIWLVVPLAIIGVTVGLLTTQQPFGFMALLGFLSLSGMLIKNAIVLIDEINLQRKEDKPAIDAITGSAVSRLRPVAMAAATTILGMAPLFPDAFFVSMAVTIAFGLGFATILTMIVVPVLFATIFRIKAS